MGIVASDEPRGLSTDDIQQFSNYLARKGVPMRNAFQWFKRDGTGYLTFSEFTRGVQQFCDDSGRPVNTFNNLIEIFRSFDTNSDGFLSIDEFCRAYRPAPSAMPDHTGHPAFGALPDRAVSPADNVLARLAGSMSRSKRGLLDWFKIWDRDKDRLLSRAEIYEIALTFEPHLSRSELDAFFSLFDVNADGQVDLGEFVEALEAKEPTGIALKSLTAKLIPVGRRFKDLAPSLCYHRGKVFDLFDRDHDGYLTRAEWQNAMRTYAPELDAWTVDKVFNHFDANGKGLMSVEEFAEFLSVALAAHGDEETPPGSPAGAGQQTLEEEPWERIVLDNVRVVLRKAPGLSIVEVFHRLDVTKSSMLSRSEFRRVLLECYPDLTEQEVDSLFAKVNISRTGAISVREFVRRFG